MKVFIKDGSKLSSLLKNGEKTKNDLVFEDIAKRGGKEYYGNDAPESETIRSYVYRKELSLKVFCSILVHILVDYRYEKSDNKSLSKSYKYSFESLKMYFELIENKEGLSNILELVKKIIEDRTKDSQNKNISHAYLTDDWQVILYTKKKDKVITTQDFLDALDDLDGSLNRKYDNSIVSNQNITMDSLFDFSKKEDNQLTWVYYFSDREDRIVELSNEIKRLNKKKKVLEERLKEIRHEIDDLRLPKLSEKVLHMLREGEGKKFTIKKPNGERTTIKVVKVAQLSSGVFVSFYKEDGQADHMNMEEMQVLQPKPVFNRK